MKKSQSSAQKVEQLGRYGASLSDMPKEAFKGQGKIIFTSLRKKFGFRDFHAPSIEESDNHLRIVVDRCLNVDAGRMFDCPEIAKLGCDHDLAGYPPIEDKLNMEFRRPTTIAKGDSCCEFNFYRKGFAPAGAYVNK